MWLFTLQGLDRAGGKVGNKGGEAAETGEREAEEADLLHKTCYLKR